MNDAQLAVGVFLEDLGGASVLEMLVGRFSESASNPGGIETKRIAGDGGVVREKLNIDHAKLHADRGLFVEVLATAPGDCQAAGFGANGGGGEDSGVRRVEFFQKIGRLGGENVPEAGDLSADFLWGKVRHRIKLS